MSVLGKRTRRFRLAYAALAGLLLSAMTVTDGAGLLGHSPAGAREMNDEERAVTSRSAWGTYAWSAPIEWYEEIPYGLVGGYPMADVMLGTPPEKCESRAAGSWFSYAVEEAILPSYYPGEGNSSPDDPGASKYRPPTLARSANPPYKSQYGDNQEKAELKPTGDSGPVFTSACETPLAGKAFARHFTMNMNGVKADQGVAETEQRFDTAKHMIVTNTHSELTNLSLGTLTIKEVASFLTVELPPDSKPNISYRIVLQGISGGGSEKSNDGGQDSDVGDKGLVISGQSVGGADMLAQFNQQMNAHQDVVKALGRYGVRVLAPNIEEGRCWGRGVKEVSQTCKGWYLAEGPVLDAGFGPNSRENQIFQYQAMRLGSTRFFGHYNEIDS